MNKPTLDQLKPILDKINEFEKNVRTKARVARYSYNFSPSEQQILDAAERGALDLLSNIRKTVHDTAEINMNREWTDWRTQDPTKAIEHIREEKKIRS